MHINFKYLKTYITKYLKTKTEAEQKILPTLVTQNNKPLINLIQKYIFYLGAQTCAKWVVKGVQMISQPQSGLQ